MKSADPLCRWCASLVAGSALLGGALPLAAQPPDVPRRAEIVEDEPDPAPRSTLPVPDNSPPKAEIIPDDSRPAPPKATPGSPQTPPAPAKPRAKSPEEDLFDYCELLFAKGDHTLAIRQYEEYLKIFPNGKFREEARFKIAEAHYRNQAWDLALMEFDSYLRDFPGGRHRVIVLYHAGECHRTIAGKLPSAEERATRMAVASDAYQAALQTSRTGPYAAYSAFRLASFAYNAAATNPERYQDAIRWFGLAAAQAPTEQAAIRHASLFFKARSCKFTGALKEAAAAFEEVTRVKTGNEYYEKALMELATLDMEAGRSDAAMRRFELLAKESLAAETRGESMVNAGMIHADAGRTAEAIRNFEEAAKLSGAPLASVRARYGLVFAYFKQKAYAKVIDAWRGIGDYSALDNNTRARLLLIVGTCYAAAEQHSRAAEIFAILEENMPEREEALEGGYKRLVSLFKMNDPVVPEAASDFVERWRERRPESDFLDKAWMVRAAYYFNRSIWEQAAAAYQKVRENKLEPAKLATWLYQRGFAEASAGDKQAAGTLTRFIEKYPQDERLPMATLQRGLANLKLEDYAGAVRDFETVRDRFPKSEGAESASYHLAKVKGMKQDYPGMVADFQRLLKDFPRTKVAAEASYWIGTGYFQQKKYAEAVDPLRTARDGDTKSYYTDATLMIIGALTAQKEIEALMVEVDSYLKGTQQKKISPDILRWLGRTVFLRQDYRAASRYLSPVVTYDDPRSTTPEIWGTLGESQVENGSYESAIVALDHQLASDDRVAAKVKAHLLKGRAFFALGKLEEATASVEAGLDLDKETLLSAQLRLVLGDVAMASKRFTEAISSFGLVMQNWEDATITPLAMTKLIAALEKSGTPEHLAKAEATRKELQERFPRYQPDSPQ
jgi:tetratricopeptide (TPR) repeat protein